jgi:uncharacterized protein
MTEQEIDRLEELLSSDAFNGEAMTLDTLQGFLSAVASSPETIPQTVWLAEAIGESPRYDSPEQEKETIALLLKFHDTISSALANGDDYDLILYGLEEDAEELDYTAWCDGYIYGSQIGETNWFKAAGEFTDDLGEKMEVFFLLNGLLKEDALKHKQPWLTAKEEERALSKAQEDLPVVIGDIYRFWKTQRASTNPIQRESDKIGRNDPCPCGSGKKFKQCCGNEPTIH